MKNNDDVIIAVVCGGPGAEAEVSRSSARGVAKALNATYSHVVTLELDRRIGKGLEESAATVVFPILHGPPGEDGTFQGFLEIIGMPYVGSGVQASAYAMDKIVAKQIFRSRDLPAPRDLIVSRDEGISRSVSRIADELGSSVVVKPARQGSAIGVSFPTNAAEIETALEKAFIHDDRTLVEEMVRGKEITCAVLERDGIEALPVVEIVTPQGSWYDYEHRYTPGLSEHIIPARLPKSQYDRIQEFSIAAHRALGCRDLSRADFVVPDQGDPVLLEVNTLPGMTPTSLYPDAARAAGISFEELVAHLARRALNR